LENQRGSAAFDLNAVRQVYPGQKEMDVFLERDGKRFQDTVARLGLPRTVSITRILQEVSDRFLDEQVRVRTAVAELGASDPEQASPELFKGRRMTALGLPPLAFAGGAVRRDAWEEAFDQVLLESNQGSSIVPLDGLLRTDYQRQDDLAVEIETRDAKTDKKRLTFNPGDEAVVVGKNNSKTGVFIELIGTGVRGRKKILFENGTVLQAGKELRFPSEGSIKVKSLQGKETVTLFASKEKFPAGELLRLSKKDRQQGQAMVDRIVHPFYKLERKGKQTSLAFDPATIVKKTLDISTD
jgi:hypothetical protein